VAPLSCPQSSTSHHARTSARNATPAPQRDRSQWPRARRIGTSTLPDGLVRYQVPYFSFFQYSSRAHVQHSCRIADATGIERQIDDLALDVRRWPSVSILAETRPVALWARPAPIPLLAVPCCTMAHHSRPVTMRAVQHVHHPKTTRSCWSSPVSRSIRSSRSTPVKHLPRSIECTCSLGRPGHPGPSKGPAPSAAHGRVDGPPRVRLRSVRRGKQR
jgi:hypothetical protein